MAGKRRANGEGSIVRRADGRWMARLKVIEPNGIEKTRYLYASTKEDVAKKLRKAQKEVDEGRIAIKNGYTISSFYANWRNCIAPNYLQPATIEQYDWVFNKYVIPKFGNKRLECLLTSDIQNFVNLVYNSTRSARTCKEIRNCLSGVLKYAIKQRLLTYNPVVGVESPQYRAEEKQPWSIEELNYFLSAAASCRYFPIFRLISYYGMRKGEALGLRVKDMELLDNTIQDGCYGVIHLRQQVSVVNNRPIVRDRLKTEASKRDLPITKEIYDFLLPLLANKESDELLFHTASNKPINPNNLLRSFKREAEKAGLRKVTLHSLRHTACTSLRDAGVDPKTAQVILGHADISTTLKIYTHSDMGKKVEAMDKLMALYNRSFA